MADGNNYFLLFLLGLVFFAIGVYVYRREKKKYNRLKTEGTLIIATVTSVLIQDNGYISEDSTTPSQKRTVYFTYIVRGEEHKNMVDGENYKEGDKIELYVNEDKPSDFILVKSSNKIILLLFAVVGFAMMAISIYSAFQG